MLPLNVEFDNNYQNFFYDSIEEYVKRSRTILTLSFLDKAVNRYFSPHISSFKELVLASPDKIEDLVKFYQNKPEYIRAVIDISFNMNSLYSAFTKGSFATHVNKNKLDSKHHFSFIDFENCPYCNENKIVSWSKKKGGIRRSYDWDHFVPKKAFPFLAISLYNLVPSCKLCNFLKLDTKVVGLNPHYKYSIDELLTFSVRATDLKYFESTDDFEIRKNVTRSAEGKKLESMLNTIYLDERYSESKQMLRFTFRKYRSHSRSTFTSFEHLIGAINPSQRRRLFESYFSVYTEEETYKHMPYSKLLSDTLYRKNTH